MLALSPATEKFPVKPLCDWPRCEESGPRPYPGNLGTEEEEEPSVLSTRSPHLGGRTAGVHAATSYCDEWGVTERF